MPEPHKTIEGAQEIRLKRFKMGLVIWTCNSIVVTMLQVYGYLSMGAYLFSFFTMVIFNILIYSLLKTRLNLHLKDPSVTFSQILFTVLFMMNLLYQADGARSAILILMFTAFIFGMFRLNTREYASISITTICSHLMVIGLLSIYKPNTITLEIELMQWAATVSAVIAFVYLGGYLNKIRIKLHRRNKELSDLSKINGRLARIDDLTQLYNRRFMMEQLNTELERFHRTQRPFCVVMADLDYFKTINDQYGHLCGDHVLKNISTKLQETLRATDVVGRYGGEEFFFILPETGLNEAGSMCDRIRGNIADNKIPQITPLLKVTISMGLAQSVTSDTAQSLLSRADTALYEAKDAGRNTVFPLNDSQQKNDL